jgi:bifunctional oligoribonuclease and PAP phosphatase NrnA
MPETTVPTTSPSNDHSASVAQIRDAIVARQRFLISSHARPDGDSIGSQLALAYALKALGKHVDIVNKDAAPSPLMAFPGVEWIRVTDRAEGDYDAVIVLECSELGRTGVEGLDRYFLINIDHHPGNAQFGRINWFNGGAAACAEMVFDVVEALAVPLSVEIATHVYVGILTDTGSFHYSSISPRTFDICRQLVEAGVDPPRVARSIFDSNSLGRLKLFGAVLSSIELEDGGRLAVVRVDRAMAATAGGSYEDTEGLINLPLTVREIQAVVFFKEMDAREFRVSMRSKGDIDVCAVAKRFGGGGHKNASGCTVRGEYADVRARLTRELVTAIQRGVPPARERRAQRAAPPQ